MKVILLKAVPKLGKKDDIVEVNQGYAANALFPKKLAVIATDAAISAMKTKHENKEVEKKIQHDLLDRAIAELAGKSLVYKAKANEKGSLFSKVDTLAISAELLKQLRLSVDSKLMTVEGGMIKDIGTYTVTIKDGGHTAEFSFEVVKE